MELQYKKIYNENTTEIDAFTVRLLERLNHLLWGCNRDWCIYNGIIMQLKHLLRDLYKYEVFNMDLQMRLKHFKWMTHYFSMFQSLKSTK